MTTLVSTLTIFVKTLVKHLWLSISSVDFYKDVFCSYKGYGLKYIFTLSFISSFICSVIFLADIDKIQKYLTNDIISNSTTINIDHIVRQLPTIDYNGTSISVSEDSPVFIYDINNVKLIAIDTAGKLPNSDKAQIPILLMRNQMNINLSGYNGKVQAKYAQIFGSEPQVLTKEIIKSRLASYFWLAPEIVICIVFPITTIMIFINALFQKILMITAIFVLTLLIKSKSSFKDCVRVVLFSSGVYTLLQLVADATFQWSIYGLWILQIWANFLMIIGVMKSQGRSFFAK